MFKISKNANINYLAKIVKIEKLVPIDGADNIQSTIIDFQNVIVSKDVVVGDLMVYFPVECQLTHEFASNLNLYRKSLELNKDKDNVGGFFEQKRRVRAIKLLNTRSQGFLLGEKSFNAVYPDIDLSKNLNKEFDSINGEVVLVKYEPPAKTISERTGKRKRQAPIPQRIIDKTVYLHVDTANLRKFVHKFTPDTVVSITEKLHGCAATFAHVPVKRTLNLREKAAKLIGVPVDNKMYDIIYCSRNVIKNRHLYKKEQNHYYKTDIWGDHADKLRGKIPKNYSIYGEIVGFTPGGAGIQGEYDYGCDPNTNHFYAYRVTHTNCDGQVWNLTTPEAKKFCNDVGIDFVPFIYNGPIGNYIYPSNYDYSNEDNRDFIETTINVLEARHNNFPCKYCKNDVPAEGITVRAEGDPWNFNIYKLKSADFLEKESKQLDSWKEEE